VRFALVKLSVLLLPGYVSSRNEINGVRGREKIHDPANGRQECRPYIFKKLFELIGPYEFGECFGETFAW